MAVSIIDGTITEAVLKSSRRNLRIYRQIVFRLPDGGSKTWQKAVVDEHVAPLIQPGTSGRFYLFTAVEIRGIHGVRDDKGGAVFTFPKNTETASLICAIMGAVVTVLLLAIGYVSLWPILLMVLGVALYVVHRSTRLAAVAQYEADAGYRPPPPAAA
jgi:hypothetical protein